MSIKFEISFYTLHYLLVSDLNMNCFIWRHSGITSATPIHLPVEFDHLFGICIHISLLKMHNSFIKLYTKSSSSMFYKESFMNTDSWQPWYPKTSYAPLEWLHPFFVWSIVNMTCFLSPWISLPTKNLSNPWDQDNGSSSLRFLFVMSTSDTRAMRLSV